ncbi:MAG: glycosyltransferase family 39 protein [Gemmatimonadetes bacterium]|nr:glycosyltransferase family 39 protein [Gemmatimonadota bacterium]MBI3504432.1 glycosyltransferase family 39 protein [Pseudomonadota bacterium]
MTPRPPVFTRQLAAFAVAKLLVHVIVNAVTRFGFQRDEFLYFAMGEHLRLWRMDFPPGIAMAANLVRFLLGDSMTAIRMVPAVAGAATLVVAVLIARELGGGRFAQGLTALAFLTSPLFLRTAGLFQPVVLDQLAWTLALYFLVRIGRSSEPRWWLLLGVSLGVGLLVKFSVLIFGFAVLLAILATPHRSALTTRWPWIAAAIAFAIGSPSIVGQLALHFPVVGQMAQLRAGQLEHVSYLSFFAGQLEWGPPTLVAIAGLWALMAAPRFATQRLAGWACVFVELVLMLARGKSYYAGPVLPTLIAAGATWFATLGQRGRVLGWSAAALFVVFGALAFPISLPVLSPAGTAAYIGAMHLDFTRRNNQGELEVLPQDFADMMGWEEQVAAVDRAYDALTPEQRREVVIGASNYGRAGAIDYYGPRHGLPKAISSAGSYWFWGPGTKPGNVALIVENDDTHLKQLWDDVRAVQHVHSDWSVAEERDANVYLCQKPKRSLQDVWPTLD